MKGTELSATLQKNLPEMVKIMLTELPEKTREIINLDVDTYITKTVNPDTQLKLVEGKLRESDGSPKTTILMMFFNSPYGESILNIVSPQFIRHTSRITLRDYVWRRH